MTVLSCTALVLALAACHSTPDAPPRVEEPPFPEGWQVLDVTRPLDGDAPYVAHPEGFPFERIPLRNDASGRKTAAYSVLEHMGTHVEAPLAYLQSGASVDRIGASGMLAPLVVLDPQTMVVGAGAAEGGLGVAAIRAQEVLDGTIPRGSVVVLRTGRGQLSNRDVARTAAEPGAGWSAEAVRFLARERGASGLGSDALTLDPGGAPESLAARAAAEEGVYALLGLADLARVPRRGAFVVVAPIPLVGGAAAQARTLVLVPPPMPSVLPGRRGE